MRIKTFPHGIHLQEIKESTAAKPLVKKGSELIRRTTAAARILIGIEDNKSKVYDMLRSKTNGSPLEMFLLKTKYPQGAEKNLIYALLRREVPGGCGPDRVFRHPLQQNLARRPAGGRLPPPQFPSQKQRTSLSGYYGNHR